MSRLFYLKAYDTFFEIEPGIYSKSWLYEDISFVKSSQEESSRIFARYADLLNSFDPGIHLQITHLQSPQDSKSLKEQFHFPTLSGLENEQVIAKELNDLMDSILDHENCQDHKRVITLSFQAKDENAAKDLFDELERDLSIYFSEFPSKITPLSCNELIGLCTDFLGSDFAGFDLSDPGWIVIGDSLFSVLFLDFENLPGSLTPRFYQSLCQIEGASLISSIHITPADSGKMIQHLKKKKSGLETERHMKVKRMAKQGIDYFQNKDDRLEVSIDQVQELIEDVQQHDQKLFFENLLVLLKAKNQTELENRIRQVRSMANQMLVHFKTCSYQQIEGLTDILPFCHNRLQFQHQETTEAIAVHTPFYAKDFFDENALFFGSNLITHHPIFLDRRKLINGNGCVLATSGAGKSFQVKLMAEQILLQYPQDEVILLDFQKEYEKLVENFNGQSILISNQTKTYLNPLDLHADYSLSDGIQSPVKAKTEYLQGFVEAILDEGALGPVEKSLIDRCTRIVFQSMEENGFQKKDQPYLIDLYNCLNDQPETEAKRIARALERFVFGSLDLFAHESNVELQKRLVSFDLSALPASIQSAGYLVVLDHITSRLNENRRKGINTWIFIDEGHIVLAHPAGAAYISKLVKIGRKYNAYITLITQNITDVLEKEEGRKILGNAEFALILKQKSADLELISKLYDISEDQAAYIGADAKRGQGIIIFGKDIIPFYHPVSRNTKLYELNNTDRIQIIR